MNSSSWYDQIVVSKQQLLQQSISHELKRNKGELCSKLLKDFQNRFEVFLWWVKQCTAIIKANLWKVIQKHYILILQMMQQNFKQELYKPVVWWLALAVRRRLQAVSSSEQELSASITRRGPHGPDITLLTKIGSNFLNNIERSWCKVATGEIYIAQVWVKLLKKCCFYSVNKLKNGIYHWIRGRNSGHACAIQPKIKHEQDLMVIHILASLVEIAPEMYILECLQTNCWRQTDVPTDGHLLGICYKN